MHVVCIYGRFGAYDISTYTSPGCLEAIASPLWRSTFYDRSWLRTLWVRPEIRGKRNENVGKSACEENEKVSYWSYL